MNKHKETKEDGPTKFDEGKLRYDLVPVEALEKVVEVLTYGAGKYDDNNWKKGADDKQFKERLYAAVQRHLMEYRKGIKYDFESHKPHLAHAITSLMFLLYFDETEYKRK